MVKDWTLFVTGRMRIKSIVPYWEYAHAHPRMKVTGEIHRDPASGEFEPIGRHPGHRLPHGCIEHVAIGEDVTPLCFDNPVPPATVGALRLGPKPGRELPIKGIDGDRLTRSLSLQAHYRRLSEESAVLLAGLVERRDWGLGSVEASHILWPAP
jgi:hypothetical protein